ncbi:MAG TPA: type I methionyl aminopeptidase [Gemmatimonadaceae bacterium]|jgi:methionyl aminopeptidase|nr:type I methionyl aminopeptidase [Gemmatimonadaceae bacterium]
MIKLKSARELEVMAHGGKILAATLDLLREAVKPGMTTLDLDRLAEEFIRSHEGAVPAFKGLYGFPRNICTSVNEEIVHGIPAKKRVLQRGDIVSLDAGVGYQGLFTDSAITVAVGAVDAETKRLLEVTRESLEAGIAQAVAGNHVGDIGSAVQEVAEAAGFSVVRELVGHGVGKAMHEDPQVPNYGKPHRGAKLMPGLTIAIEPMVNAGGRAVQTLKDGWTIVTADGSRSAHFEHTVAITDGAPLVLTRGAGGKPAVRASAS